MEKSEFRAVIKYYYLKEKTAKDTKEKLDKHYGKTIINKKTTRAIQNAKNSSASVENASSAQLPKRVTISEEIHKKDTDLSQMKAAHLRTQLRAHGLSVTGRKQALIERWQNYLQLRQDHEQVATAASASNSPDKEHEIILTPAQCPPETSSPLICARNDSEPNAVDSRVQHINHSMANIEFLPTNDADDDVSIEYIQGLPHLTVPLPSRNEKCRFALKPVSHKVGDLLEMLKEEDRGIDRATVLNQSGVRIASTCNIESIMDEPFWLYINDQKYKVVPPKRQKIGAEDLDRLGDIRSLVTQLYEALHVGEYHIHKEQELVTKLEDLKYQISPLEKKKTELSHRAERRINLLTWAGLGFMSVQFGILARLTWWEYSWDIMEPVTYFVTYGTAMAMYAYYCITKTEYNLPEMKDREYLLTMHKNAKKKNFDIDEYNTLRRQIAEIEYDLRRLRDPLNLQLPPHVDRAQRTTPVPKKPPKSESAWVSKITADTDKKSGFKLPFLNPKN